GPSDGRRRWIVDGKPRFSELNQAAKSDLPLPSTAAASQAAPSIFLMSRCGVSLISSPPRSGIEVAGRQPASEFLSLANAGLPDRRAGSAASPEIGRLTEAACWPRRRAAPAGTDFGHQ